MANPTCPQNCEAPLPVITADNCDPEINLSEIEYLLLAKPGSAPISDIASVSAWSSRISNTATGADAIRQLVGSGELPAPTDNEVTYSKARTKVLNKTFVVNFDWDETSDANYNAARQWQCTSQMLVWFVTRSGHVFGGTTGILASVKFGINLAKGDTAYQIIPVTITWKNKFNPERNVWPLAGTEGGGEVEYDTTLDFTVDETATSDGVSATVTAINANQKFEFVAIDTPTGTPASMTIEVGGTTAIVVDYPDDYSGTPFRYTHTDGTTTYTGVFTNGTVSF